MKKFNGIAVGTYAAVVIGFSILSGIIAPALVGKCRYEQAQQKIQYRLATEPDFGSDSDLVNVMDGYGFGRLGCGVFYEPKVGDFIKAGFKSSF